MDVSVLAAQLHNMVPTEDFGWRFHNLQVRVSWMPDNEKTFPGILDKTHSQVTQY